MKLIEGMDETHTSTPTTNGDRLPNTESLKTGSHHLLDPSSEKSLETCVLNGSNGKSSLEKKVNGNSLPSSPDCNSDLDGIGIEVESYSDVNSPSLPDNENERRCDPDISGRMEEKFSGKIADPDNNDTDTHINDYSVDEEGVFDSSHLSEEFQLRLSDDDDQIEETSQIVTSNNPAVSSTIERNSLKPQSPDPSGKDSRNQSGSGTLEGTIALSADLSAVQENNDIPKQAEDHNAKKIHCEPTNAESTAELTLNSESQSLNCQYPDIDESKSSVECCDKTEADEVSSPNCSSDKSVRAESDKPKMKEPLSSTKEETQELTATLDEDDKSLEIEDQVLTTRKTSPESSVQSLDEKIEAELEAELTAEIAAQREYQKEDVQGLSQNVTGRCTPNKSNESDIVTPGSSDKDTMQINCTPTSSATSNMKDAEDLNENPSRSSSNSGDNKSTVTPSENEDDFGELKFKHEIKEEMVDSNLGIKKDTLATDVSLHGDPSSNTTSKQEKDVPVMKPNEVQLDLKQIKVDISDTTFDTNIKQQKDLDPKPTSDLTPVNEVCSNTQSKSSGQVKGDSLSLTVSDNVEASSKENVLVGSSETHAVPDSISEGEKICEKSSLVCGKNLEISSKTDLKETSTSGTFEKHEPKRVNECILPLEKDIESIGYEVATKGVQNAVQELEQPSDASYEKNSPTDNLDKNDGNEGIVTASAVLVGSSFSRTSEPDESFLMEVPDPDNLSNEESQGNKTQQSPGYKSPIPVSERNFDCLTPDSAGQGDDSVRSDNVDDYAKSVNGDDCDIESVNDQPLSIENDSEIKDKESLNDSRGSRMSNFSSPNHHLSVSPSFCDSTVLDATPADDVDSQDCSSTDKNEKGSKENSVPISRKRTLSQSGDELFVSLINKRLNGLSKSNAAGANQDNGLKRPAEVTIDSDPKKSRTSSGNKSNSGNNASKSQGGNRGNKQETTLGRITSESASQARKLRSERLNGDESVSPISTNRNESKNTSSDTPKSVDLPFLRKLYNKELSQMSRSDLEELVLQKICEAITERSTVGELRLRCQALEQRQEKENEKFAKLRKQMNELSIVMRKYLDNQKHNIPGPPIKVTRSVGLQVSQVVHPFGAYLKPPCPVHQSSQVQPSLKPASTTPLKPDSVAEIQKPPVKVYKSPQNSRSSTNIVSSTDPPALVPTGLHTPGPTSISTRLPVTPPRVPMPPLQQIPGTRPRLNIASPVSSPTPQLLQMHSKQQLKSVRQSVPHSLNNQMSPSNIVEVIDIENEDQSKRQSGSHVSAQQMQHQQKQAANAVAQSLAGNNGLTVRLISPTQVSQASGAIASCFPQLLVPQPKVILATSSAQGNTIRGNLKLVMKSNQANVIIPMQSNLGATVPSSVVHIPSSTQTAVQQIFTNASFGNRTNTVATVRQTSHVHPAPLPLAPAIQAGNPLWKQIPPRPNLKIQHQNNGIVLSWNMVLGPAFADIESYQLFAYQEGSAPPNPGLWKKVGDVKALPLPMACTLTQFVEGHRYHFTVRAVDKHGRVGPFSQQGSIRLGN